MRIIELKEKYYNLFEMDISVPDYPYRKKLNINFFSINFNIVECNGRKLNIKDIFKKIKEIIDEMESDYLIIELFGGSIYINKATVTKNNNSFEIEYSGFRMIVKSLNEKIKDKLFLVKKNNYFKLLKKLIEHKMIEEEKQRNIGILAKDYFNQYKENVKIILKE